MKRLPFIAVLFLLVFSPTSTSAHIMTNDTYELQPYFLDRVNLRIPAKLSPGVEEIAPPEAEEKAKEANYTVEVGYPYAKNQLPYSVFTSANIINFSNIVPGEPLVRNVLYEVNANSLVGYVSLIQQDLPLSAKNGQFIPDTSCDSGACTEMVPAVWKSPLTYGYGYRCDGLSGIGCSRDFENKDSYKRISSLSEKEAATEAVNSYLLGTDNVYQFTHKVNISPSLTGSSYKNVVKYIILPYY